MENSNVTSLVPKISNKDKSIFIPASITAIHPHESTNIFGRLTPQSTILAWPINLHLVPTLLERLKRLPILAQIGNFKFKKTLFF